MSIIEFEFENFYTVLLRINWIAIIVGLILVCLLPILWKYINKHLNKKSINVSQLDLGIGNSTIKLTYNRKDQEVAYKLWVELSTRKIGIPFDEENDVIVEVYNSWYEFFKIARETIKEIPAERIPYSSELINLTEQVLNEGLRPHLTKWQAKFRFWYNNELEISNGVSPQEIQKNYPEIKQLVDDLKQTNIHMINYKNLMKDIAFKNPDMKICNKIKE